MPTYSYLRPIWKTDYLPGLQKGHTYGGGTSTMCFVIWNKGQDQLETFLRQINDFHHSIKFTAYITTYRINFLDTTVNLDIRTDLYTNPTDTHQCLSPDSCHPRHCSTSIPYSQSLRTRRICSSEDFTRRTSGTYCGLQLPGITHRPPDSESCSHPYAEIDIFSHSYLHQETLQTLHLR